MMDTATGTSPSLTASLDRESTGGEHQLPLPAHDDVQSPVGTADSDDCPFVDKTHHVNETFARQTSVIKTRTFSERKRTRSNGSKDLKFDTSRVEKLTEDTLVSWLKDEVYEPVRCKKLSQQLAAKIMSSMQTLRVKSYKFVAVVSIGSLKERPGMQFGTRCLWNEDRDSFASVKFTNGSLFALAMVYGIYIE